MSSSLLVLLLFSVILFHSCEKEGNHLKDTIDQEIVIQVSNEIMKLNSVEEYKKSQIEVLQMTFEELNKSFKQRKIMNLKVALILFLTTIVSLSNAQDESKKK